MTNIKELALSAAELDHCYEHSHGNTPYTKAKAYGRMIEKAVHAKYAKRGAEAVPSEPLPPIESDDEMERHYIPVHPNWEIQTKGTGSSFRIAKRDDSGNRWLVSDKYLHAPLEQMARDIHSFTHPAPVADAHELWAAAQLVPGEGIEDGVARIEVLLKQAPKEES